MSRAIMDEAWRDMTPKSPSGEGALKYFTVLKFKVLTGVTISISKPLY